MCSITSTLLQEKRPFTHHIIKKDLTVYKIDMLIIIIVSAWTYQSQSVYKVHWLLILNVAVVVH